MNQYEIEIKLPVKSRGQILEQLKDMGFLETAYILEEDTYFNSVYHDMKQHDEALRIRKSTDLLTGNKQAQINFKGPKLDQISMSRMELETKIKEADVMKNILLHLDFQPVAVVSKRRNYLKKGDMTACVDLVKDLGAFLELEVIAESEEKRAECLERMGKILTELGYSMKDTVRTSYLGMLMENKPGEIGICQ